MTASQVVARIAQSRVIGRRFRLDFSKVSKEEFEQIRLEYHRSLHFELCYYRAIDYCIDNALETFEAGAQGEHKLSRGFLPVMTFSAHGVLHPDFRRAIGDFTRRERVEIGRYIGAMAAHSPFRIEADRERRSAHRAGE